MVVCGLAAAITLFNLYFLFGVTKWVEDFIFESLLDREFSYYEEDSSNLREIRYPFHAYNSIDSVPEDKRKLVSNFGPGLHEIEHPLSLMVKIGEPSPDGSQLIIMVATNELEYLEQNLGEVLNFSILALLVALAIAFGISLYLVKRIIDPLKQFTSRVGSYEPDSGDIDLSGFKRNDEIGQLAIAFDGMQRRIASFIKREKRFTSDVSHELRTPLTVLDHSLEMLRQNSDGSPSQEPFIARIERSSLRMRALVETFLALARKPDVALNEALHSLHGIVEEAAQFHDLAFPKNPVKIVNSIPLESKIAGDSNLLGILIRNLVNNAALHAPGKTLTVLLEENTIVFENQTTRTIEEPSYDGTGIGLSIVERVCARLGFKLIRELKSDVFRVRIRFS